MNKVALVIDNSAYISDEEMKKYNVAKIIPISFIVNGEEYYENVNMTYNEFFEYLKDKNTNISTSQPSIEIVKEGWREVLKEYDEIVYILLSSGLSEACNTAINASREEEFDGKVFVVNNQRVSYMNKAATIEASYLIKQGKSAKEIKDFLEETKMDTGVYVTVDTLKYLKKGGRVTPAAAAIGTLLNIKPILQIHGGKLDAYAKVMSMKQGKAKMINAVLKEVQDKYPTELKEGKVLIGMAHSFQDINAEELKICEKEVREALPEMPFFTFDPLPLFIDVHLGPSAIGVGYVVDRLGILKDYQK